MTNEYALLLCTRSDRGGGLHVAGYIDQKLRLNKEKIIEIISSYYRIGESFLPIPFIEEVLRKRFHMDEHDFELIQFE
jgi:uncharacterized protein YbgA (DUF1722 family)